MASCGHLNGALTMWHLPGSLQLEYLLAIGGYPGVRPLWKGRFQTHMESRESLCIVTHRQF